ncbi:hypothetical protein VTL71DRAFT_12328 [Oculimacula yallundae]|uniref:Uncharacterized protein n=1 Tax=Oculimacula yallundae TaxID=86028 RepID=A0ABR4CP35_9HELO
MKLGRASRYVSFLSCLSLGAYFFYSADGAVDIFRHVLRFDAGNIPSAVKQCPDLSPQWAAS